RKLDFYAYDVLQGENVRFETQGRMVAALRDWGFHVEKSARRCDSLDEVIAYHAALAERRDRLEFEIDGVVVKVDRRDWQELLGVRSRSPRWAVAFKFPPREEITSIDDRRAPSGSRCRGIARCARRGSIASAPTTSVPTASPARPSSTATWFTSRGSWTLSGSVKRR